MATARFEGGRGNVELIHARKVMNAAKDWAIRNLAESCFEYLANDGELIPLTVKSTVQRCSW